MSQKNIRSGILIFSPRPEKTGPEGWAGKRGNQNFRISAFFIYKGSPLKSGACDILFMRIFNSTHPEGPRGTPRPIKVKIKSKLGYFYRRDPTKIKF